jgi:tRNA 2-thiocytidine biosynthesis protein TtcA
LALVFLLQRLDPGLERPFELRGLHLCLDSDGKTDGLAPEVHAWCESMGLSVEEIEPRLNATEELPLDCFRCARVRRRSLLEAASERGCSHLALGHHADDVVDTWLLSLFYTGRADTMLPRRSYFGGAVTLIRPLYELTKRELIRLGRLAGFPETSPRCNRDKDTRRSKVAEALASLGHDERQVRRRLFWAAVRHFEAEG